MAAPAFRVRVKESDRAMAEKAVRSLSAGRPLIAYDEANQPYELTSTLLATIREVLARAIESDEYVVVSQQAELSPEEAAKVLGVSRPLVYHRMDSGRLPFREVGTHRRVLLKDVLALKECEAARRDASRALSEDTDAQEPAFGAP